VSVYTDEISFLGGSSYALTTAEDTWYTWLISVDQSGSSVEVNVYRKEDGGSYALVATETSITADTDPVDRYQAIFYGSPGQIMYEDYIYYANELPTFTSPYNYVYNADFELFWKYQNCWLPNGLVIEPVLLPLFLFFAHKYKGHICHFPMLLNSWYSQNRRLIIQKMKYCRCRIELKLR